MNINTLVKDIYETVSKDGWLTPDLVRHLHSQLAVSLNQEPRVAALRLSQMGPKCPCHLWHSIHSTVEQEPLPPWAKIKYTYGHVIEALAICMIKAAGHEVTGEQDELILDGVKGHRDCVVDGCVVDVKSTSSMGFKKFKEGTIGSDDPDADMFGYLDQLDGYVVASADDPLVRVKDRGYLLAIDKTLGHVVLYEHKVRAERIRAKIQEYKHIVGASSPPPCVCKDVPDGRSGNFKLDTRASYSPFKYCCNPRIRTFLYAEGPRYLTRVVRKPDVPEVDRHGKLVYN